MGPAGVAACAAAGLTNCAALQTTFAAPAVASTSGPVDSFAGTPVDFQYINGNLVRNAGQSLPIYRFDISLTKAIKIPRWESASLELKMDVFNLFNHPGFIFNNSFDTLNLLPLPTPDRQRRAKSQFQLYGELSQPIHGPVPGRQWTAADTGELPESHVWCGEKL